jgi:hypothetical protein
LVSIVDMQHMQKKKTGKKLLSNQKHVFFTLLVFLNFERCKFPYYILVITEFESVQRSLNRMYSNETFAVYQHSVSEIPHKEIIISLFSLMNIKQSFIVFTDVLIHNNVQFWPANGLRQSNTIWSR